jgi:ferrous iron transport protein B
MLTSLPVHTPSRTKAVVLAGNPNCGKSTIFNALTGFRQRVGNYPGVTVERRTGWMRSDLGVPRIEIMDLPGTYSLAANALDESVVLDALLGQHDKLPDVIVNVVDAANLGRNLFFTTQLLELGIPVIVALNMTDIATSRGIEIDVKALEHELGVPVAPVVGNRGTGMEALQRAIVSAADSAATHHCASFPECVCAELDGLCRSLSASGSERAKPARAEAMQTLLNPGGYHEARMIDRCGLGLAEELAERRRRIASAGESLVEVEARVRYAWIDRVVHQVVGGTGATRASRTELVDKVLTHPVLGLAVVVLVMGACFQSIYAWSQPLMDGIDAAFALARAAVAGVLPVGPVQSLVSDGMIAGVGAVLVFLPQILILFLFIALLEDCGYMARAAFLVDRWMTKIGLPGKAFIPLLSSFACAVPGIMATRTIEDRRDRMVTILIAPLMSCSARLPVYVLFIGAFIPSTAILGGVLSLRAVTLISMYVLGTVVGIAVALLLKRTVLQGPAQSFLMELPAYKWPSLRTVFFRVYEQGRAFCVSAGTLIFAVTIVIWALGYYPRSAAVATSHEAMRDHARVEYETIVETIAANWKPGATESEAGSAALRVHAADQALAEKLGEIDRMESGTYLRHSMLGRMGQWIEPLVAPLGWDWRIGTAVISAFPAREVIVATMGTIYNLGGEEDENSSGLRDQLQSATWPDGRRVFNPAVALSIMVFFALCCQCGGTLAVIRRETNSWRWPAITFAYMTGLAYVAAMVTYQVASRLI